MIRSALLLVFLLSFPAAAAAQQRSAVDVSDTFVAIRTYQRAGHQAYVNKQWGRAAQIYRQYLALSPMTATHEEITSRLYKAERLLNQRSSLAMTFLIYPESFGGSIFDLIKDDWSFYLSFRGRNWVAPDVNELDEEEADLFDDGRDVVVANADEFWTRRTRYTRTEEGLHSHFVGTLGITQKLYYPLWLNVGITAGYQERYYDLTVEKLERGYGGLVWAETDTERHLRDENVSSLVLGTEAGLLLRFGWITAQYGATYTFGQIGHYFGVGFSPPN